MQWVVTSLLALAVYGWLAFAAPGVPRISHHDGGFRSRTLSLHPAGSMLD